MGKIFKKVLLDFLSGGAELVNNVFNFKHEIIYFHK